jgi:pyrroline-5-carboxylate reductase
MTRYGFIGTGSMGGILVRQLVKTGAISGRSIALCSKTGDSARALAAGTSAEAWASGREVAGDADVLFICVRPLADYLVRQTLIGTTWLLNGNDTGFDEIIGRVTTRGGITEEGIKVLDGRLPGVFDEMLEATLRKRREVREKIAEQDTAP